MANAQKLPSGSWRVRVYLGEENGKKKFKSFTADTRWKAEKAADEFIKSGKQEADKLTVGEAINAYIESKRNILAPATIRGYEIIRRTRLQSIMDIDINELNSLKMQMAINEDAARLSWKSCKEANALVLTALKMQGVKPDINITLPAKKPKIKELPTAEKVFRIIKGTEVELPCLLALWLSLRISEVRGLQFCDINKNVITVQRSKIYFDGKDHIKDVTKTYKSTRQLTLPKYIAEKISDIPHNEDSDYIISDSYQYIANHFKKLMDQNGIKMTLHDLRHLNASVMLMLGVPDKYAMERGGWSTNDTLKRVYQHTFTEERKQVDLMIDDYFNRIIEDNRNNNEKSTVS